MLDTHRAKTYHDLSKNNGTRALSNGRTTDSGSVGRGSTPCARAILKTNGAIMNYKRNPFILGLWAPAYLLPGTVAITNDFLMAVMFILSTLGILGAYVTEFPIFPTLYQNEVLHKAAISSLLGIGLGMIIGLAIAEGGGSEGTAPISTQGKFILTWGVMSLPAYPLMVFLVSRVNKRDLEEENRIREKKKKERKSKGGGPPIMDREGF